MIAPGDLGKIDTESMTLLLAYQMKSRGTDATGILTVDKRGRWKVRKNQVPADVFMAGRQGIGVNAQTLLLHTRAATQGKASNHLNNHPIVQGDIIGVHNGVIFNDDDLFRHFNWKRNAEVDSEAIFAALNHLDQDQALENIDGSWAIAWVDIGGDPRRLWLARGQTSPLHYATTENGSVVFASTYGAVTDAFKWGDITGKPDVKVCPEGFLAYAEPDSGLTILPEFDGSGKKAVGTRPARTFVSTGTTTWKGGWDKDRDGWEQTWEEWDEANRWKSIPEGVKAGERQQVTGLSFNPKVGDRRRYWELGNGWVYETCTSIMPLCWQKLSEHRQAELDEAKPKLVKVEPQSEALPFDEEEEATDDVRYGFAGIGDLILYPGPFTRGNPSEMDSKYAPRIVGMVVDDDNDEFVVEWRVGRISRYADYEVLIPAQKGT